MHAPLELLAGVVAAAANGPVTPPVSSTTMATPPAHPPAPCPLPTLCAAAQTAVSAPRAPSPMLSAPIPHLSAPLSPPSDVTVSTGPVQLSAPPSVPTTATATATDMATEMETATATATAMEMAAEGGGPSPQKRAKGRGGRAVGQAVRRVAKRPFEAASGVVLEREASPRSQQQAPWSEKSASAGAGNGASSGREGKGVDEDSQDNKRAMRAERNRQSAAASRERKKRHIKELEERVKYLTECNTGLQYRLDMEKQGWEEKELCLQQEIARLRHQLSRESAFRASSPPNHPMTLHHLTHRGPVTY